MTYEIHKPGMCDKCGKNPEKWQVPFQYKDMNDKSHFDICEGYRQYWVCESCKVEMDRGIRLKDKYVPVWIEGKPDFEGRRHKRIDNGTEKT
jgi:hypothetical protein